MHAPLELRAPRLRLFEVAVRAFGGLIALLRGLVGLHSVVRKLFDHALVPADIYGTGFEGGKLLLDGLFLRKEGAQVHSSRAT